MEGESRRIEKPERIATYFHLEKWTLAVITVTGIFYNVGMTAGPWFEGQLAQRLCDIILGKKVFADMVGLALLLTGGQAANIFMVSGFVRSVPKELDEAATIDGAGTFRIFWQIIVPAIKPILGVIALFAFRTAWNEFVTAQVFTMSNPGLKTLSVAVANLRYSANAAAEWHIMTAGASIALIPILIVYLLANRQFITGLTAGAVKG